MAASAHLRLPPAARPRTALLAALLALALLAGWELVLAQMGVKPTPRYEDKARVAAKFHGAAGAGSPQVLVLGSSRVYTGISTREVRTQIPLGAERVRILACPATSSMVFLRAAADTHGGAVVYMAEVLPAKFYPDRNNQDLANALLRHPLAGAVEDLARSNAYSLRVSTGAAYVPIQAEQWLRYAWRGLDRDYLPRFARPRTDWDDGWLEVNLDDSERRKLGPAAAGFAAEVRRENPDLRRWHLLLAELTLLDQQLRSRGCVVVFVRFPSSGVLYEAEQEVFPDHLYWDRLVEAFPGRAWHFRDNPEFRDMDLPDGSHMVSEDARRFSRWLGARVAPLLAGLPKQDTD